MLIPVDSRRLVRRDSVLTTRRRPSDVYGDTARAQWKQGRRPLARSAAAIRAAKSAIASTGDTAAVSLNCSLPMTKPDNLTANDKSVSSVGIATKTGFGTSPIAEQQRDSAVVDRPRFDSDRQPVSSSKYNRRKGALSRRQEPANDANKPNSRMSNRTDEANSRNASLTDTQWSAWRSPPSSELSPVKDNATLQDDENANIDDMIACDIALPIVPIDEKYASKSLAAMKVPVVTHVLTMSHVQPQLEPGVSTSTMTTMTTEPPVCLTSTSTADSTFSSTAALARSSKLRNRAEHTIFEQIINTLSLHKTPTSEKDDVIPTAALTDDEVEMVPNFVSDAKIDTKIVQDNSLITDVKQLETTHQLSDMPKKDDGGESIKMPPCDFTAVADNDRHNSISGDARSNTVVARADGLVEDDVATGKYDNGKFEHNGVKFVNKAPQNEERKTRGVNAVTRNRESAELLVTSRPVRKRQPSIYDNADFDTSVKSRRKVTSPAAAADAAAISRGRGSCLLPLDFYLSPSISPGVAQKSWKTVLEAPERLSTNTGNGRPTKTNRQYVRRKKIVLDNEIKWTIHKKLLLGGSTSKNTKPARTCKFGGRRKTVISQRKSSTVDSTGRKLRTRSMTRTQSTDVEQKSAVDATAQKTDALPVTVSALAPENEVPHPGPSPNCQADSATIPIDNDANLLLSLSYSEEPAVVTKSDSSSEDMVNDMTSSDAACATSTTKTNVDECVDKSDAVETAAPSSSQDSVQPTEPETEPKREPQPEPEVAVADRTSDADASLAADQSDRKLVDSRCTSTTTTTNNDEKKVDDESVEALMSLVHQIQHAVANEKLRIAKGALISPTFTDNLYPAVLFRLHRMHEMHTAYGTR